MEDWRKDARREPIIVDLDALVPKDHLLRKIEKIMTMSGYMNDLSRTTAMTTDAPEPTRSC